MADTDRRPLRRTVLGPVMVTGVLTALAMAAAVSAAVSTAPSIAGVPLIVGAGWVLAWLLLGLAAGYALSGST